MPTYDPAPTTLVTRAHASPSAISFPFRNDLPLTPDFAPNLESIMQEVIVLNDDYDPAGDAGFAEMLQDSGERGTDNDDCLSRDGYGQALGQFQRSPATNPDSAFSLPVAFANDMSFEDYMSAEKSKQLSTMNNPPSITPSLSSACHRGSFGENIVFSNAMSSFGHDLGLADVDLDRRSAMRPSCLEKDNKDAEPAKQECFLHQSGSISRKDDDFDILFGSPDMSHREMADMFFNFRETAV